MLTKEGFKVFRFIGLSVLLSAGQVVSAADEPNLCAPSEDVYFSCATEDKILSVCLSKDFSAEDGKLTYRFGTEEDTELAYSSKLPTLNNKFNFGYSAYPKGSTTELSFVIDEYTYTVHQDLHVFKPNSSGVFVEKNMKEVAYIECDTDRQEHDKSLFDLEELGFKPHEARNIGTIGAF